MLCFPFVWLSCKWLLCWLVLLVWVRFKLFEPFQIKRDLPNFKGMIERSMCFRELAREFELVLAPDHPKHLSYSQTYKKHSKTVLPVLIHKGSIDNTQSPTRSPMRKPTRKPTQKLLNENKPNSQKSLNKIGSQTDADDESKLIPKSFGDLDIISLERPELEIQKEPEEDEEEREAEVPEIVPIIKASRAKKRMSTLNLGVNSLRNKRQLQFG